MLLRQLWTEQSVTFSDLRPDHRGRPGADAGPAADPGLDRRPLAAAYRRAGRLADGWFPQMAPGPELEEGRRLVTQAADQADRDPASLGMEGRLRWQPDRTRWRAAMRKWQAAGATQLSVNTMGVGLQTVEDHLAALATAAETARTISG